MRRFTVIGNLTKDAEVKEVKNRKAINFGIAHNEVFKDTTGEKVEKTTFYNCTIWRDENVKVAQYLTKGTKVLIEGVPEAEMYRDKNSEVQLSIKIIVSNLELIGGGNVRKENSNGSTSNEKDSDLPF